METKLMKLLSLNKNIAYVILALALAILISGAAAQEAFAKKTQNNADPAAEAAMMQAKNAEFDRVAALMEKYMYVKKNGQLGLDNAAFALELRRGGAKAVDPAIFSQLKISLAKTNKKIRDGEIVASDVFPSSNVTITEPDPTQNGEVSSLRYCPGINGTYFHWWGYRTYLDDCRTHTLVWLLSVGAGGNAIAAYFGWVPGGLIGPILGIYAGTVVWVDDRGGHNGIYFTHLWSNQTWFWHQ